MKEDKGLTYSQALSETEQIVRDIESQEIDIDLLAEKVKRASELINFCRSRLRKTEEEIDKVFEEKDIKQDVD